MINVFRHAVFILMNVTSHKMMMMMITTVTHDFYV